MGVAYKSSMSKLVLRFQFVRAYINIYTNPLERITLHLYYNVSYYRHTVKIFFK